MTHQEKCSAKFLRRKSLAAAVTIFPHGYNTIQSFIHDGINTRARIAGNIESTKRMIIQCNATPFGKDTQDVLNATLFEIYTIFPNKKITQFKNT